MEVKTEQDCFQLIRHYLSYFPNCQGELPPRAEYQTPGAEGLDPLGKGELLDESVLDLLPENPRASYDMRTLIGLIADGGESLEIKPKWAKNITTAYCRIGGMPVGIVANNPKYLGGVLDVDAADKAARFVSTCDAFNIPLVFLMDVPGFVVGSVVEQQGIIRHGAKMLFAVASATVPKMTVITRKAYGAGYYVMCGRAYEPDLLVAWPTAEISVMGPEGMVSIFARKMLAAMPDEETRNQAKAQMTAVIREGIDPYLAAGWAMVDDIIDPRETRQQLIHTLVRTRNKRVERPARKHGVVPV